MEQQINDLKEKGQSALSSGKYDEAIDFYTEAINLDSTNHALLNIRSSAYSLTGKYDEALKDAENSLVLNATCAETYLRQATALLGLKNYESAQKALEKGSSIDSSNIEIIKALDDIKKENKMDIDPVPSDFQLPPEDLIVTPEQKSIAKKEKEFGNDSYKKKDFDKAIEHYKNAINSDPTDITYYSNIAAVYFEQKDYQKCIAECERGIEIGRRARADFKLIAKAFARIGNAYKKLENYKLAKYNYEKAMSEHRTPEVNSCLSEVIKVIKEAERTAYIDPVKAEEEKEKGNELFKNGDYTNAVKHYSDAIKRNPTDPKLYSNRAACYTKLAAFDLGLKDCDKCIELDSKFIKGWLRKGKILEGMQQKRRAFFAYQKALEIDPTNAEALQNYRSCAVDGSLNNSEKATHKAMADPEIQAIIKDPAMHVILQQMNNDPKALMDHLKNPTIANKFQKLIEHGIIQIE